MSNGIWSLGKPLPMPNNNHSSVVAGDMWYVFNGRMATDKVWGYNLKTEQWSELTSTPYTYVNPLICVANANNIHCITHDAHHIYDTNLNAWRKAAALPKVKYSPAGARIGGKIYCVGGDYGSSTDIYDIATNTWSTGKDLPVGRSGASAIAYEDKLYYMGGRTKVTEDSNRVDIYEPKTDMWTRGANMPTAKLFFSCVELDGKIYTLGGYVSPDKQYTNIVEIYDVANNQWTNGGPMIYKSGLGTAVQNERKIHYVGGTNDDSQPLPYHQIYTIQTLDITIHHQDHNYKALIPPEVVSTVQGTPFTVTAKKVDSYTLSGYQIDEGPLQIGDTATIDDIQSDHIITFIYQEDVPSTNLLINQSSHSFSAPVRSRPLGDNIVMTAYDIGLNCRSTVFDGQYLWLIPDRVNSFLSRLDIHTGEQTNYPITNGENGNSGLQDDIVSLRGVSVFDGRYVWILPTSARRIVVKLDTRTGTMTGYSTKNGENGNTELPDTLASNGGVFDGTYIWLAANKNKLVRLDPTTGTMHGFDVPASGGYNSILYDGKDLWLIPTMANMSLTKISLANMKATEYPWPAGLTDIYKTTNYFVSGAFDGQCIWMFPYQGDKVVKFNPITGSFHSFSLTEGQNGNSNMGELKGADLTAACFDGRYIWVTPERYNRLLRLDSETGSMRGYSFGEETGNWSSIGNRSIDLAFDGKNVWLAPLNANRLLKVSTHGNDDFAVLERYTDRDGTPLQPNSVRWVAPGEDYTSAAPKSTATNESATASTMANS